MPEDGSYDEAPQLNGGEPMQLVIEYGEEGIWRGLSHCVGAEREAPTLHCSRRRLHRDYQPFLRSAKLLLQRFLFVWPRRPWASECRRIMESDHATHQISQRPSHVRVLPNWSALGSLPRPGWTGQPLIRTGMVGTTRDTA